MSPPPVVWAPTRERRAALGPYAEGSAPDHFRDHARDRRTVRRWRRTGAQLAGGPRPSLFARWHMDGSGVASLARADERPVVIAHRLFHPVHQRVLAGRDVDELLCDSLQ